MARTLRLLSQTTTTLTRSLRPSAISVSRASINPTFSCTISHIPRLQIAATPAQRSDREPLRTPLPGPTQRLPEFSLAGKTIVVTGAARGLGLTLAEALLEAGAIGKYACPNLQSHTPLLIHTTKSMRSTGFHPQSQRLALQNSKIRPRMISIPSSTTVK